jgi:hypothetical protein
MSNAPQSLQQSLDDTRAGYRTLGNSGLRVSVPIFGAMSIGDQRSMPWTINEEDVSLSAALLIPKLAKIDLGPAFVQSRV